jgi:hypothetical protein
MERARCRFFGTILGSDVNIHRRMKGLTRSSPPRVRRGRFGMVFADAFFWLLFERMGSFLRIGGGERSERNRENGVEDRGLNVHTGLFLSAGIRVLAASRSCDVRTCLDNRTDKSQCM